MSTGRVQLADICAVQTPVMDLLVTSVNELYAEPIRVCLTTARVIHCYARPDTGDYYRLAVVYAAAAAGIARPRIYASVWLVVWRLTAAVYGSHGNITDIADLLAVYGCPRTTVFGRQRFVRRPATNAKGSPRTPGRRFGITASAQRKYGRADANARCQAGRQQRRPYRVFGKLPPEPSLLRWLLCSWLFYWSVYHTYYAITLPHAGHPTGRIHRIIAKGTTSVHN
jgi:hypothetical protein